MYGKIWTVQRRSVVNYALKKGVFYPIFAESDFVKDMPQRGELYDFLLRAYYNVNRKKCDGLIFGFLFRTPEGICYLDTYADFVEVLRAKKDCIGGLWKHFLRDDYDVVELEVDTELGYLPIDINDFQLLLPPVMCLPPYTEEDIHRIMNALMEGVLFESPMPSNLIQVHLPFLAKENISGIYPMFEI